MDEFLVGFEFECATDMEWNVCFNSIQNHITSKLGFCFIEPCFHLDVDNSIKIKGKKGVEIVTEPLEEYYAMLVFDAITDWMCLYAETNRSTGLHVNLSVKGKQTRDLNPLALILESDDWFVAKDFSRQNNKYCIPMQRNLKKLYRWCKPLVEKDELFDFFSDQCDGFTDTIITPGKNVYKQGSNLGTKLYDYLDLKYCGINFYKYYDGYIEFRVMGGKDYHKNQNNKTHIETFKRAMKASFEPYPIKRKEAKLRQIIKEITY